MKKYLLAGGAATAVVLLVLASFTSVVGYNSVKSSEFVDSPLFGVRTKKAIDFEPQSIVSKNIGQEKIPNFEIPSREPEHILIQKIINVLKKMDKKSVEKLKQEILKHSQLQNTNLEINNEKIISVQDFFIHHKKDMELSTSACTLACSFTFDQSFICLIESLLFLICWALAWAYAIILWILKAIFL